MNNSKDLLAMAARVATIIINISLIVFIAFLASLYLVEPDMASSLAHSCISCKRPSVKVAGPQLIDKDGKPAIKDWRIILSPGTVEPVVVPEPKPSEQQQVAIDRVNYYRDLAGLRPVTLNKDINEAAQAHADYNVENNLSGHTESEKEESFSGTWPWDRMKNYGYDRFTYATEVCSTRWASTEYLLNIDPKWSVDGWVDTVYHRLPILSPDVYEAGFGAKKLKSRIAYVMDFGNPGFQTVRKIICYPVDGQTNVPVEFTGDEKPDPLPGKRYPVGYPITVTFNGYKDIKIEDVWVIDESGSDIKFYKLLPFSDKHIRDTLAIVPVSPLKSDTKYHVEVNAVAGDEPIYLEWEFKTAKNGKKALELFRELKKK